MIARQPKAVFCKNCITGKCGKIWPQLHHPIGPMKFFKLFIKNGPSLASFQTNITIFNDNYVIKCLSSIRCRDSNSRPAEPPNQGSRPIKCSSFPPLNLLKSGQKIFSIPFDLSLGVGLLYFCWLIVSSEKWNATFYKYSLLGSLHLLPREFTLTKKG